MLLQVMNFLLNDLHAYCLIKLYYLLQRKYSLKNYPLLRMQKIKVSLWEKLFTL